MTRDKRLDDDPPPQPEGFVSRWSRRKRSEHADQDVADQTPRHDLGQAPEADDVPALSGTEDREAVVDQTDADMPSIESLGENSDYSGFMSSKVSAQLRRLALRKFFHQPKFNVRDHLDCHVGDFTKFEPLGDTITADMRHQIERAAEAARNRLNQVSKEAPADDRSAHSDQASAPSDPGSTNGTGPKAPDEDSKYQSAGSARGGDDETDPA